MKKLIILLLIFALCVASLASCANKNKDENSEKEPTVDSGENDGTEGGETENGMDGETDKQPEPELPGVDFLDDDLSEYVEIDEQYYKGFDVMVDPNRVSALEVENKIIQLLCKHKSKESVEGDGVISVGDVAHIYYKGYYIKEDGEKHFFQGGDNTAAANPHELEIGSGGFIPGFEYNLIGKNPADYTEENPIVVETFFPENYQSSELAGKTAYFIVTVVELEEYDAPEFDDAFVTETLKITEEELSKYEGDTLADKARASIKDGLIVEQGLDVDTLILDAFWESVMENARIKKYPEKQLKESYDALIAELEYYYNYYSYYYKYDEFMCLYLGLEVGDDWKAYVEEIAEAQVKQQLIFYHIMNVEGLKPNDEEYAILFDEYLVDALTEQGITPDKYESEDKYLEAKEKQKQELLTKYGEDYFRTMIYYETVVEAIIGFANVIEITE